MSEIVLPVTGMTCGGCVNSVHKVLMALAGVQRAEVTLNPGEAHVTYDAERVDRETMVKAIVEAGFGVVE